MCKFAFICIWQVQLFSWQMLLILWCYELYKTICVQKGSKLWTRMYLTVRVLFPIIFSIHQARTKSKYSYFWKQISGRKVFILYSRRKLWEDALVQFRSLCNFFIFFYLNEKIRKSAISHLIFHLLFSIPNVTSLFDHWSDYLPAYLPFIFLSELSSGKRSQCLCRSWDFDWENPSFSRHVSSGGCFLALSDSFLGFWPLNLIWLGTCIWTSDWCPERCYFGALEVQRCY